MRLACLCFDLWEPVLEWLGSSRADSDEQGWVVAVHDAQYSYGHCKLSHELSICLLELCDYPPAVGCTGTWEADLDCSEPLADNLGEQP